MVGTATVIGIFSCFCSVVRFSAIMAPSLNDIWIHGCLVLHVPELPAVLCLASWLLEIRHC